MRYPESKTIPIDSIIILYACFSIGFTSEEDLSIISLLERKVTFTRRLKKMISFETTEPYLLDMSDYKTKKTIKFHFVRDFDESLIKLVVSYLEIKEIIWGRAVSKKFRNAIDDYIKDLVTIGIYYFEKAKVISFSINSWLTSDIHEHL